MNVPTSTTWRVPSIPASIALGGLRDQVAQQRVRRAGMGDEIGVHVRAQVLGSRGHDAEVSDRGSGSRGTAVRKLSRRILHAPPPPLAY